MVIHISNFTSSRPHFRVQCTNIRDIKVHIEEFKDKKKYLYNINIPFNGLLIIPPMPCIENQNICIFPFQRAPIHLINFQGNSYIWWRFSRRSSLRHKKWSPIVLHCAIIIHKLKDQKPFVLCYWAAIHFID